jgi:hypothetical protein
MNTDNVSFLYTANERMMLSSCAPRELKNDDWFFLEAIAVEFLRNSLQTILAKRDATQVEKSARKLELTIKQLPPIRKVRKVKIAVKSQRKRATPAADCAWIDSADQGWNRKMLFERHDTHWRFPPLSL